MLGFNARSLIKSVALYDVVSFPRLSLLFHYRVPWWDFPPLLVGPKLWRESCLRFPRPFEDGRGRGRTSQAEEPRLKVVLDRGQRALAEEERRQPQREREERRGVVLYRVQVFRARVEYESEGVEYESSTSRVLRIHSKKRGSSPKNGCFESNNFHFLLHLNWQKIPPCSQIFFFWKKKKKILAVKNVFFISPTFSNTLASFSLLVFSSGRRRPKKAKKKKGKCEKNLTFL